jgi:hypothetical protein
MTVTKDNPPPPVEGRPPWKLITLEEGPLKGRTCWYNTGRDLYFVEKEP